MPVTIKWGSHLHLYLVYSKSETTCLPKRNIAAVLMALVLQPATFHGHAPTTMILTRHSFPFLQRIVLRSLFLWKVVPTLYIWAKLQPMTAWYILSKRSVVGCKALPSRALVWGLIEANLQRRSYSWVAGIPTLSCFLHALLLRTVLKSITWIRIPTSGSAFRELIPEQ